ncbi:DUF2066 domain-containing protein, partial [Vibrio makurazakiensis]|uniref:DUF2066 domain-containing protein n=1 Tax=Vibrio makurazakiensis TaxID=2910250 RepID=UPI003D124D82
ILVWLVEDKNYDRTIAWEHSNSTLRVGLLDNATRRGLPLTLPVGDFDDITGIEVSDLWGSFVGPISASSKRYPVDAVLVIRAQRQGLRWTLYDQKPNLLVDSPKAPITGSASGNTQVQAKRLIDEVSDYYANKSAVTVAGESSESQLVNIVNVQDAQDFFELENGLKALNSVASLDILNIQNNQVTFKVHLLSSPEEFTAELRRIRQLSKVELLDVTEEIAPELEQQVNSVSVEPVKIDSHTEASVAPVTVLKQGVVTTQDQLASTVGEPAVTTNDEAAQLNVESGAIDGEVTVELAPEQAALNYQWTKS